MSTSLIVLLGFSGMAALIVLQVPIGIAMMAIGSCGFAALVGAAPALSVFGDELTSTFASADLAVVPVFLLMGSFASAAGLSEDLYRLADALVGHRRGGMAMATIGGCAGFGALCGSSLATVGTMHQVAYPEMIRRGYAPHFAAATIAVGGTLGILIPPSIIMVIYAVLSETFVVDLYVAALVPAVFAVGFYLMAVYVYCTLWPDRAPASARLTWSERLGEARRTWGVVVMVTIVVGGIYFGIFTAMEAAAVGAVIAFAFLVGRRRFTMRGFLHLMGDTATTTGMIYVMVIGASVFNYFIAASHMPEQMIQFLEAIKLPHVWVIALILVAYIVLGAVFDEVATMLITLPCVLPLIKSCGYDPVWWGIVNVTVIMIGLFCPPIGLNVMVMHGLVRNVPISRIYQGVVPYLIADFLRLALLVAFPVMATWLPATMKLWL
jgi:tripartite ATP-independent transporter DctM subunit